MTNIIEYTIFVDPHEPLENFTNRLKAQMNTVANNPLFQAQYFIDGESYVSQRVFGLIFDESIEAMAKNMLEHTFGEVLDLRLHKRFPRT